MTGAVFYRWTRDLHLYAGLFISPFLLLFAISVFFLNHAKVAPAAWASVDTFTDLQIPDAIETAQGKAAIAHAQEILRQVGADGEIGFTRFARQSRHFIFPVSKPGVEANVDVDLAARTATVSRRPTSVWEAFAYLHKMPGPHNVAIRGNWWPTRLWRGFADATIYLIFFISFTGVYLWWVLKAERRAGFAMLSAGLMTFIGLMYVFLH